MAKKAKQQLSGQEKLFQATQWQLMVRKFKKHKLAQAGLWVLVVLYIIVTFCEFVATQDFQSRSTKNILQQPMAIHMWHEGKFIGPFVYTYERSNDPVTLRRVYTEVKEESEIHRLGLFVQGDEYKLWGLIPSNIHFVGTVDGAQLYLFGTDASGRDLFSRVMIAIRMSLTVGLVGVFFTFILGWPLRRHFGLLRRRGGHDYSAHYRVPVFHAFHPAGDGAGGGLSQGLVGGAGVFHDYADLVHDRLVLAGSYGAR